MSRSARYKDESGPAIFSPDHVYRYLLRRRVYPYAKRTCVFIMLNPSTANEWHEDPTVRRCKGFALQWGYGILEVVNLFALRATDPIQLYQVEDPICPKNDQHILEGAQRADLVVAAWGNRGGLLERSLAVMEMLKGFDVYCLGLTASAEPKHPLYVARTTELIRCPEPQYAQD